MTTCKLLFANLIEKLKKTNPDSKSVRINTVFLAKIAKKHLHLRIRRLKLGRLGNFGNNGLVV